MNAQHAAPKTPRADRSNVVQTRPPIQDPTQVLPAVPAGPDQPQQPDTGHAQLLTIAGDLSDQVQINSDDLARPWDPTWHRGDPVTARQTPSDPTSPVRGVAVGVPSPDSVFLDPSKIDFQTWAADWLADTAPVVHAKAQEYGSNSLVQQGRRYARGQKRDVAGIEAMEIGCWSYAAGKMDRVEDAIQRRDLPGRDTWHDIAVYALMVLYMREVGRWP